MNTFSPLVSIIIPVYNGSDFILNTLNKVLQQTWQNVEIIVVDDGSTDNTADVVASIKSDKIRLIKKPNGGAAAARNVGIRNSAGQFIQFLDADDYLSDEKIENQIKIIYSSKSEIESTVVFCSYKNDYGDKIRTVENNIINRNYNNPPDLLLTLWRYRKFNVIHSYLIPRNLILKSGFWNESLTTNDDGEFIARLLFNASVLIFDNKSTAYYVFNHISLSKAKNIENYVSRIESYGLINELFKKTVYSEEFESYYKRGIADLLVEAIADNNWIHKELNSNLDVDYKHSSYSIFKILYYFFGEYIASKLYFRILLRIDQRYR